MRTLSVPSRLARKATVRSKLSASAPIADKAARLSVASVCLDLSSLLRAIWLVRMHKLGHTCFPSSRVPSILDTWERLNSPRITYSWGGRSARRRCHKISRVVSRLWLLDSMHATPLT